MHFAKYLALAALIATGALAAPAAEANPNKPAPPPPPPKPTKPTQPAQPSPTTVAQSNQCGNDATPYCCNTDNTGKYTTCSVLGTIL